MRGHDNEVAAFLLGCRDNGFRRVLVRYMNQVARNTLRRRDLPSLVENLLRRRGGLRFVLSKRIRLPSLAIRAKSKADQSSVTVTTVTGALCSFASAMP